MKCGLHDLHETTCTIPLARLNDVVLLFLAIIAESVIVGEYSAALVVTWPTRKMVLLLNGKELATDR